MPGRIDAAFAFLFVVVSVIEQVYFWPRFRADADAERPRTRTRAYRVVIVGEWLFALAALAIWTANGRSWSALSLSLPHGWRLVLGAMLVLAVVALLLLQRSIVARLSTARRVAARPKLGALTFMIPRTREEQLWFLTLAATAGFCEELLFRGYLPWLLVPWLGSIGSMTLAVILFGLGHAYQGRSGIVKVMITGAVMAIVVLATRSLIPAMLLHALIDTEAATAGYLLMRDDPSTGATAMRSAPA
jgi:membrane protease YdiL (CAAX protease family)